VDRRTALGGGDWIGRSPEWVGDGEAPATEEADDVDCFDSWRPVAPGLVMGLTEEEARREAAARDWRYGSPAVEVASGAGARDGAERGTEEESDFALSMGHNSKGIRVTGGLRWWAAHADAENHDGARPGATTVPCAQRRHRTRLGTRGEGYCLGGPWARWPQAGSTWGWAAQ
jgi:hypothetical protein